MGRMVKQLYIGAYIDVNPMPNLFKIDNDLGSSFHDEVIEKNFVSAYQGLEEITPLIPIEGKEKVFSVDIDMESEFILVPKELNLEVFEKKLEHDYKNVIEKIKTYYPDSEISVKSGIISYWDEE